MHYGASKVISYKMKGAIMDIKEIGLKIRELKRSRNTTVFAYHYAPSEIHEFADVLGDSRIFFEADRVVADRVAEMLRSMWP